MRHPTVLPRHRARARTRRGVGFEVVGLEVDRADERLSALLSAMASRSRRTAGRDRLAAEARPGTSPLPEGYGGAAGWTTAATASQDQPGAGPHRIEARLRQTSLYRPDLDLVVFDRRDRVAAYGLFWYDPETATGLVEPMRTEDEHQRRGLARHVLTTGIDLLAEAGAARVKICYESDNPAAGNLYLSAGFVPERQTVVYARRPSGGTP